MATKHEAKTLFGTDITLLRVASWKEKQSIFLRSFVRLQVSLKLFKCTTDRVLCYEFRL